jgi:ribonuclease BN (tRNA processing enzyme)
MKIITIAVLTAAAFATCDGTLQAAGRAPDVCPPAAGVAVQVLGSGGPVADDARASSGYLVWVDGRARVLVDAGGGSFLRFGEAGARFEDLELVALSHFHTDHSADLPALLKSGYFSQRKRGLAISGPGPGGGFPGLEGFLSGMFDQERGSYAYLSGYLDGSGGLVRLQAVTVDREKETATAIIARERLEVSAIGVPHGIVPSLAYRVEAGGVTAVFASDQNGSSENFAGFAHDADILIAHLAIPEAAGGVARRLHAPGSVIGQMAAKSGARILLLSHFMARSLSDLDHSVEQIRLHFYGGLIQAQDLTCISLESG